MSDDGGPYCPACDEPISGTASYCMHCYEDLPADWAAGEGAATDPGSTGSAADDAWDESGGWDGSGDAGADAEEWEDGRTDASGERTAGATGEGSGGTADPAGDVTDVVTDRVDDGPLLDPDGLADNTLTVLVAIAGSVVIGFVGFLVLAVLTESAWAIPVGVLGWLGGLAYLARQYSVQETVAKTFFGVAAVLLAVPLVSLGPGIQADLAGRASLFGVLLLTVAVPALVSAGIGYGLLSFAPEAD